MQNVALGQMNNSVHGVGGRAVMRSKKGSWSYEEQGAAGKEGPTYRRKGEG